jgi:hypothetical protein
MKRLKIAAALALTVAAASEQRAAAWYKVNFSCGLNLCVESTGHNRCFTYSCTANPPPCYTCCGTCPAPFDALHAYGGYPGGIYGAPAVAAAPAAGGTFVAPAPTPAPATNPPPAGSSGGSGAQQTAYTPQAGYGYYGYQGYAGAYGPGTFQAPSYWYGN